MYSFIECLFNILSPIIIDFYIKKKFQEPHHDQHVQAFLQNHEAEYQAVKLIGPDEGIDHITSRNIGL